MIKSLPERLREAAEQLEKDELCCPACVIKESVLCECEKDYCTVKERECLAHLLDRIASEVERDYIKAPRVCSGEIGDSLLRVLSSYLERLSDSHVLRSIDLNNRVAKVCDAYGLISSFRTGDIEMKLTFREAEKSAPDTLEAIEGEATMSPVGYCCKHANADISEWDASEYSEWMIRDLLRRQREVLERDAEKPEERTCENVAAYFGDFECSECGSESTAKAKYCPGCGAKVV